jgi:hypothetical protein
MVEPFAWSRPYKRVSRMQEVELSIVESSITFKFVFHPFTALGASETMPDFAYPRVYSAMYKTAYFPTTPDIILIHSLKNIHRLMP